MMLHLWPRTRSEEGAEGRERGNKRVRQIKRKRVLVSTQEKSIRKRGRVWKRRRKIGKGKG